MRYIGDGNVRASTIGTRLAVPGGIALRCGAALLVMPAGGCARGAPSLVFFGAYFPLWLACMVIGATVAGVARALMVVSGLSERLPYQLLLCTAIGTSAGLLVAMLCFGV
ncbi:hypothetical protein [Sphingomonas azotifigens]|uniref:hypothetical protein n=1 Tax=Sphingomonas azotifigens TaxID=330920 RepID=UPI001C3F68BD|nr:hypothetical protein [Sphingomonas azotifigens]